MSNFIQEKANVVSFDTADSWVILSPIELSIKRKIEAVGTPLKDWDIQINYGIKTGCNEAFIITEEKRNEILANCQTEDERSRTAEIIRPILRGKDIKRYGYDWAGLYLLNIHNGIKEKGIPPIDINDYPAIKAWLDLGGTDYRGKPYIGFDKIKDRTDQGDTPYNLRNCAYLDLFFQPKICWKAVGRNLTFSIVGEGIFLTAPASFISAGDDNLYVLAFLCSSLGRYYIYQNSDTTGAGDIMLNIQSLIKYPIPKTSHLRSKIEALCKKQIIEQSDMRQCEINNLIYDVFEFSKAEISAIESC